MGCLGPLTAYRPKEGTRLVFDKRKGVSGIPIPVPCGQCVECRLKNARDWAVRLMHEKRMHDASDFLTLTYDNQHLPKMFDRCEACSTPHFGQSVCKYELQLFMKRLRHVTGEGLRFYGIGEYGDVGSRPHYHVLLLNYRFADRRFYGYSKSGEKIYSSASLSKLWTMGRVALGDVTFASCAYCARYVTSKVTGDEIRTGMHYMGRLPEFSIMSNQPGIGATYYEKFGHEVRAHDSVIVDEMEVSPPRYYDLRTEVIDPRRMLVLKRKRRLAALSHKGDNGSRRRRVKELVTLAKLRLKAGQV